MDPLLPREIYLSTQLKIHTVLGMWPCDVNTKLWKRLLYKIIFYMMLIIKICTIFAIFCHIYIEWEHLPDPMNNILMITSLGNAAMQMLYIPVKLRGFQYLLNTFDTYFLIPMNLSDDYYMQVFEETMKSARLVSRIFIGSGISTGLSFGLIPFTSHSNDTTLKPLPYLVATPLDISIPQNYWLMYTILTLSIVSSGINGSVGCDFFVSLIIKTTCQFRFLQHMLSSIRKEAIQRYKDKQKKATPETGSNLQEFAISMSEPILSDIDEDDAGCAEKDMQTDEELDSELIQRLIECIKFHQSLLEFCKELENQISQFMLQQIFVYVIFLCLNVLGLSMVSILTSEFVNAMVFCLCVLCLLLVLAWYGNELETESLEVAQAAYDLNWEDTPQIFKNMLRILILRAQKPVKLSAWKFCSVDLPMFTMVLKATYSYYQVLHKVYSE